MSRVAVVLLVIFLCDRGCFNSAWEAKKKQMKAAEIFLYHFFLSWDHFLETILYLCDQLR